MKNFPNILLIVTDQQQADLLGCAGRLPVRTPNLDRLASGGTRFERAYTPCPLCTPARASLVTGQYPATHGAWSIGTALATDAPSVAAMLGAAGYRTGIIGKSHLRPCHDPTSFEAFPHIRDFDFFEKWSGPWYGFDEARICIGHTNEAHAYGMHYGAWLAKKGIPPDPPFFARPGDVENYLASGPWELPEELHPGAWIAGETENFLHRHADKPFYLSVNFPDPHLPFRVSPGWLAEYADALPPVPLRRRNEADGKPSLYRATLDRSLNAHGWNEKFAMPNQFVCQTDSVAWTDEEVLRWRIYFAMTAQLDAHVGRILDALDALHLTSNTLVVFTSDHGEAMGHHWLWSKGGSHYDPVVRLPFLVRWPGHVPEGRVSQHLQSLVDLPSTFLSVAGLPVPADMEGLDQTSTWRGTDSPAREHVFIDHRVEHGLYVRSLITATHRLSVHSFAEENREETELYDMEKDPGEFHNLAGNAPALEQNLREKLDAAAIRRTTPWPPRTSSA